MISENVALKTQNSSFFISFYNNHNNRLFIILGLEALTRIEVIDISNTAITTLSPEISNLSHLFELDWRETPAAVVYKEHYNLEPNNIYGLKKVLSDLNTRKLIEKNLYEKLLNEHFVKESDNPNLPSVVDRIVKVGFYLRLYQYLTTVLTLQQQCQQ
jgi:hypothetical protein